MSEAIEKFVAGLKHHLTAHVHRFTEHVQGEGGCDTCGFGAPEYSDLDHEAMLKEIDAFAAEFQQAKG